MPVRTAVQSLVDAGVLVKGDAGRLSVDEERLPGVDELPQDEADDEEASIHDRLVDEIIRRGLTQDEHYLRESATAEQYAWGVRSSAGSSANSRGGACSSMCRAAAGRSGRTGRRTRSTTWRCGVDGEGGAAGVRQARPGRAAADPRRQPAGLERPARAAGQLDARVLDRPCAATGTSRRSSNARGPTTRRSLTTLGSSRTRSTRWPASTARCSMPCCRRTCPRPWRPFPAISSLSGSTCRG